MINIDIPTAEEARKMTQSLIDDADSKQMQEVAQKIKQAISDSQTSVSVDSIRPRVRVWLESKGYEVKYGSQYNEAYCMIKWGAKYKEPVNEQMYR